LLANGEQAIAVARYLEQQAVSRAFRFDGRE
jgi:hypothetical protein